MSKIQCPECGQEQYDSQEYCSFCYARLKPALTDFGADSPAARVLNATPEKNETVPLLLQPFCSRRVSVSLLWFTLAILLSVGVAWGARGLIWQSFPPGLLFFSFLAGVGVIVLLYWKGADYLERYASDGVSPLVLRTFRAMGEGSALVYAWLFWSCGLTGLGILCFAAGFLSLMMTPEGLRLRRRTWAESVAFFNGEGPVKGPKWAQPLSVLLFLSLGFTGAGLALDRLFPVARPEYKVTVLSKHKESRGRGGGYNYYIRVAGWKKHKRGVDIRRSQQQWQQAAPGTRFRMTTLRGVLWGERVLAMKIDRGQAQ